VGKIFLFRERLSSLLSREKKSNPFIEVKEKSHLVGGVWSSFHLREVFGCPDVRGEGATKKTKTGCDILAKQRHCSTERHSCSSREEGVATRKRDGKGESTHAPPARGVVFARLRLVHASNFGKNGSHELRSRSKRNLDDHFLPSL